MANDIGHGNTGPERLTASEYRILELRARGLTRTQIAQLLNRSPQTVSNSLTLIRDKVGATSLMEAAWLVFGVGRQESFPAPASQHAVDETANRVDVKHRPRDPDSSRK